MTKKTIIVYEDGIEFNGFSNLYEILGFIDICCVPQKMKQMAVKSVTDSMNGSNKNKIVDNKKVL